ncbi:MAG: twin-arginine translocation signal domain-containing protein, partial [Syntrophales bacterium]
MIYRKIYVENVLVLSGAVVLLSGDVSFINHYGGGIMTKKALVKETEGVSRRKFLTGAAVATAGV